MAYAAAQGGSLPVRSPQVRPVHVADLLSREGHPLARRVIAARDRKHDPQALLEPAFAPRRTLGIAAGAALVLGTVVAGALGLNQSPNSTPTAASGEPVGAMPGHGAPLHQPQPGQPAPAAPAAPVQEQPFVNTAATERAPQQGSLGQAGEIGSPARINPPLIAPAPKAPRSNPPAQQPVQPPASPAPQAPAQGPVQTLTEPVTQTVGSPTLSGAVAPVTQTVDNTLQPALSLIGGLLGR
jgi:hypothetical protein